jgi:hypothetical protein
MRARDIADKSWIGTMTVADLQKQRQSERQTRRRQRQKAGLSILHVETDVFGFGDDLQEAGKLTFAQAEDRHAIAAFVARLIQDYRKALAVTRDNRLSRTPLPSEQKQKGT